MVGSTNQIQEIIVNKMIHASYTVQYMASLTSYSLTLKDN